MRINLLCIAGAALGVFALFLPWWTGYEFGLGFTISREYMLVQDVLLDSSGFVFGSLFLVACTMYVVGTMLSFWSPLGGLVQVPSVIGFLALFNSEIGVHRGQDNIALGAYIGLASAAIVVVSLLVPLGVGYSLDPRSRKASLSSAHKFITVSRYGDDDKIRLNALALCGALIAFVCMALPWSTISMIYPAPETTIELTPLFAYLDDAFSLGAYVFLIGSAAALATTLGVILQLVGFVWFWAEFADSMIAFPGRGGMLEQSFGIGFYLSMLAMSMIGVSIILPVGFGYYRRKKTAGSRIFVWGKAGERLY